MQAPKTRPQAQQKRLLRHFSRLGEQDRAALVAFAEFLATREGAENAASPVPEAVLPKRIPRPSQETVIGAIKRLSETYYMLDRSALLTETSSLMSAHIMHGRIAPEVIDDLEALFASYYRQHANPNG